MSEEKVLKIGLAGNPNCGKTCIFNELTGARQKVGNWAGVTVEKKEGIAYYGDYKLIIYDLPGTYSLTAYTPEELVARNFIIEEKPDIIVDIVDGSNLQRNLYLTTQLAELDVTTVIAMNMWDEVKRQKKRIDLERLSELLRMPMVPTVGRTGKGIDDLMGKIVETAEKAEGSDLKIDYGREIEREISVLQEEIEKHNELAAHYNERWLALKILENDPEIIEILKGNGYKTLLDLGEAGRKKLTEFYDEEIDVFITEKRYGFINGAYKETVREHPEALDRVDYSQKIDKVLTNKILGFPIFLAFMWLLFQTTFTIGAYPMAWIEQFIGLLGDFFTAVLPEGMLQNLIVDGILGGVGGVLVFLPNILILFLGISFMEDTGYMARAAFIMDRVMHAMGLHGRSFISLLMGFGCNVPAIMAARTLRNKKDRILTILLNPMMSCSARLPVYILLAGAFFANHAGTVIFSMYLLGIAMAFIVGRILKKTLFAGDKDPFVMELPPYRIPTLKSTLIHMWERAKHYLIKMGTVVLIFSIVIWFLSNFPKDVQYSQDYESQIMEVKANYQQKIKQEPSYNHDVLKEEMQDKIRQIELTKQAEFHSNTYVGKIGHFIAPVMRPLGFDWKMSVSLVTGFVAKEVVVGTLGVLYNVGRDVEAEDENLRNALVRNSGMTPLTAYAFMAFVLLYVPCVVTVVTVYRETHSLGWTLFSITYLIVIAWIVAFIIYQGGKLFGLG